MRARNRKLVNETATQDDLLIGDALQAEITLEDCLDG